MSDDVDKKAYEPMNVGFAIFIVGVLLGWILNQLGFEKLAIGSYAVAILAFFYGIVQLQRLINKYINDKFKKDGD